MEDTIIPQKAAYVKELIIVYLKEQHNLTLSFNRNTTKAQQSVYTVYVTDPQQRVFLLKRNKASALSHTQEHIYGVLKQVSCNAHWL